MLDSDERQILPHVRFYQKEVQNTFKTEKEGRPIYDMVDFVRIEIPGNQLSVIDTYANEGHKQAYPVQWARYLNDKEAKGDGEIQGTLLRDWNILTTAQVKELAHFHFYTVDQVASASDAQIMQITNIVGMSGFSFRDKAKQYLAVSKDKALAVSQAEELAKRDKEIEEMKKQLAELTAQKAPKQGTISLNKG